MTKKVGMKRAATCLNSGDIQAFIQMGRGSV